MMHLEKKNTHLLKNWLGDGEGVEVEDAFFQDFQLNCFY